MSARYAVFGNPVAHSKSPLIHRQFAEQTGEDICYDAQLVEPGGFAAAATAFFDSGGKGLNITVPFKLDAFAFARQLAGRAEKAGAVNTLLRNEQGAYYGDNTDGVGLVRDISGNLQWSLANKKILLLGAGGAARGVIAPLLEQRPAALTIANRTESKAKELYQLFSSDKDLPPGIIRHSGFALLGSNFDIVINATSASLDSELPAIAGEVVSGAHCYDMMYGREPTSFQSWASSQGAIDCADGLGMLVEQAAESFYLWRNVRPDTRPVIRQVRANL